MNECKFKVGDKVRFNERGARAHEKEPWHYPEVGTIGEVVDTFHFSPYIIFVQWPKGLTVSDGRWCCDDIFLDLVKEGKANEQM